MKLFQILAYIFLSIPSVKALYDLVESIRKHEEYKSKYKRLFFWVGVIVLFGVINFCSAQVGEDPGKGKPEKNDPTIEVIVSTEPTKEVTVSTKLTEKETEPTMSTESTESPKSDLPYRQIAAGKNYTVFILKDGAVGATGDHSRERCDVIDWKDIKKIAVASHTVGLTSNGRVIAAGDYTDGRCDVSGWVDVKDIDAGPKHTIAALSDGTVVIAGPDKPYGFKIKQEVAQWRNIDKVAIGEETVYGLDGDGRVHVAGNNLKNTINTSNWYDVETISAGLAHIVGLTKDGTVWASGTDVTNPEEIMKWKNIKAICTGDYHTVGLRYDGTVVATGMNNFHQCDTGSWTDIEMIAAGYRFTIGVKRDGSIVYAGAKDSGQCNLGR